MCAFPSLLISHTPFDRDVRPDMIKDQALGDIAGQPTTPTSIVRIRAEGLGARPVLGFKKPSIRPVLVVTIQVPPWLVEVRNDAP